MMRRNDLSSTVLNSLHVSFPMSPDWGGGGGSYLAYSQALQHLLQGLTRKSGPYYCVAVSRPRNSRSWSLLRESHRYVRDTHEVSILPLAVPEESCDVLGASLERCPAVMLVHEALAPGSWTTVCCIDVRLVSFLKCSNWYCCLTVSGVVLTPRCSPEVRPFSSAVLPSYCSVEGPFRCLPPSICRFPLVPVGYANGNSVSDVLPFKTLSILYFLQ